MGHQLIKVRCDLLALPLVTAKVDVQKQLEKNGTRSVNVARPILQSCLEERTNHSFSVHNQVKKSTSLTWIP